jgi:hypothetical protein
MALIWSKRARFEISAEDKIEMEQMFHRWPATENKEYTVARNSFKSWQGLEAKVRLVDYFD